MAGVNLFGIIMIILCINIFLYVAGVKVVESEAFLDRFIDTPAQEDLLNPAETLEISSDCETNDCMKDNLPNTLQDTSGQGLLTFVDVVKTIFDFVLFLINIIFTPLGLFINLPSIIGLMFGIPMLVAGVIGVVYLIRSGG